MSLGFINAQSTYVCEPIDGKCTLKKQYDECMALVKDGCPQISVRKTCPSSYTCCLFGCTPPYSSPVKKNMMKMSKRLR